MQIPKIYVSIGLFSRYLNALKKGRGMTHTITKIVRVPGISKEVGGRMVYVPSFEQPVEIQVRLFKQKGRKGK